MKNTQDLYVIDHSVAKVEIYPRIYVSPFLMAEIKDLLAAYERGDLDARPAYGALFKCSVGQRLVDLRNQRRLLQIELAKIRGIPQPEISRFELEHKLPSSRTARSLAKALKCDYRLFL